MIKLGHSFRIACWAALLMVGLVACVEKPQVCERTASCDWRCNENEVCPPKDCTLADSCKLDCKKGADCGLMDCRGTPSCDAKCDEGSTCSVDCTDAGKCDKFDCKKDASCMLTCAPDQACAFNECEAPTQCADGVLVCNRACPNCGDGVCEPGAFENANVCPEDCRQGGR